ncbi:hypothetical protein ARMSODRAFT_561392 [Armillaria solidipes]|uniref:Protein kinase domain-containing protein n=1 Tax=Armillaria solidipes TaxID=1076256 RepID=A0A2H3AVR5_9AGAR|nr:hypothetical protein ARMSODRAFT_561392 [Armillaria solidipes]
MSEMQDALSATIKSQAHHIRGEIHSLGNIQREHAAHICEKLQDLKGYYKGQVRELFLGDIYVGNLVSHSRCDSALVYQDRYGTVECSSTAKIIRVYQHSPDNGEAILEQFNEVAEALINLKHPNIVQVFGICRSPNFPVIVFHGSTWIPFNDYEQNLTAKQVIPFSIQLLYDLESVSEYLLRHVPRGHKLYWHINSEESDININEHGQIVVTDMVAATYRIGAFQRFIYSGEHYVHPQFWLPLSSGFEEPLPTGSQTKRWSSPLTLQKDNLCHAYDAIKHIVWRGEHIDHLFENQLYAPGSVFTSHRKTLVGRVPIRFKDRWEVKWEAQDKDCATQLLFPMTHNGSITVPLPYTRPHCYNAAIRLHSFDRVLNSWIAQASQLQSCIHSRGLVEDDKLCLISECLLTNKELSTNKCI